MTALEFVSTIASQYREKPDDEVVSIGHWVSPGYRHPELPDFVADIGVTVGELRAMAETLDD